MDTNYYETSDCPKCKGKGNIKGKGCKYCTGHGYILILIPSDRTDLELRHKIKMLSATLELSHELHAKKDKEIEQLKKNLEVVWKENLNAGSDISSEKAKEIERLKSEPKAWTPPTDIQLNEIRDDYKAKWIANNIGYPASDYLSGINDGIYHLRNWMRDQYLNSQRKEGNQP